MRGVIAMGAALVFAAGCSGAVAPPPSDDDASVRDASSGRPCTADETCDDDLFCNGRERCLDGWCVAASDATPCDPPTVCDEDADACAACDPSGADRDGDGRRGEECGGDDCDDDDPLRYPGATEICDAGNRDEDCDPRTFGVRDADSDGFPDQLCCNGDTCGTDCDDTLPGVHPTASESCDGIDQDCDEAIDERVATVQWVDADMDGAGDPASPITACPGAPGLVTNDDDCDDGEPAARPGLPEVCDGIDNDCDPATIDASACTCVVGASPARQCGFDPATCAVVTRPCVVPGVYDCPAGLRSGAEPEVCNGVDDDCDGTIDEGIVPPGGSWSCYTGPSGTVGVGECRAGTYRCEGAAGWSCRDQVLPTSGAECDVDRDCDGDRYEGVTCEVPGGRVACDVECQAPDGSAACSTTCGTSSECVPAIEHWAWFGSDPSWGHGCGTPFGVFWQARPTGICHVQFGNYRTDLVPGRTYRARFEIGVLDAPVMVDPAINRVMGTTVTDIASCGPLRFDPSDRAQEYNCTFTAPAGCAPIELLLAIYPVAGQGTPLVFVRQTEVRGPTAP